MRAVITAALLGAASSVLAAPSLEARLATDTQPVIVQLFEWSWDAVKAECPTLAKLGYKYAQVSPAAEHIKGNQWWTGYQPVSHKIISKRGNRDQFGQMVEACRQAGVGVLVDVILNHMTAGSGVGIDGTSYTQYTYTNLYSGFDFHYCDSRDRGIDDWNNKTQLQFCQLGGMADLKTESEYVRGTLVDHLNDLLSFPGVAGFRLDAAKHIPVADLQAIWGRLSRNPYVTSEVVGTGGPVPPSNYVSFGGVTITNSYAVLKAGFTGSAGLNKLNNWEANNGVHTGSATVFVATHDSERGDVGGSLTPSQTPAYSMANVFMLAYPYGTPTILSSYQYKTRDDGAPNNGKAACTSSATGGQGGFWCQHRWTAIANMVQFRTAVAGTSVDNWTNGNKNQIAFGRQKRGFVVINNDANAWSTSLPTSLPAGTYCDVVAGTKSGNGCSGAKATVSGGKITVKVPAHTAMAFYIGMKL